PARLIPQVFIFFFYCYHAHRDLHSFPTRRSSDLATRLVAVPVQELFERDPGRFERLSREQAGLLLDFSRLRLDEIALAKLFQLADRKSTRLNSSHVSISYAVFCLKKKKEKNTTIV